MTTALPEFDHRGDVCSTANVLLMRTKGKQTFQNVTTKLTTNHVYKIQQPGSLSRCRSLTLPWWTISGTTKHGLAGAVRSTQ